MPPGVPEETLMLYYWDDAISSWVAEPSSVVDADADTITTTPDHLSLWGALGEYQYNVYLPVILKE